MKRDFSAYLLDWKARKGRKPLIVRGARQVGKTYIIEAFGSSEFDNLLKINFEETPEVKDFFHTNDVLLTIQNLELFFETKITEEKTLLFLDEIQSCPEAIVSLRYFYEKLPGLHVISAGSLLDFTLNNLQYSMPVGRVEFAYLYPLNFLEFLDALGNEKLSNFLKSFSWKAKLSKTIHGKLMKYVRLYYFVGGMPEAIKIYKQTNSLLDVERVHESILRSLEFDFSKYGTPSQQQLMTKLLTFIPKTIGQKFKYSNFDPSIRSDTIKQALLLLSQARIVHLIHSTRASSLPLETGVQEKVFKPLFLDIGLMNHILKLRLSDIDQLMLNNEGNLAEQFIGQELMAAHDFFIDGSLYYWMREKRNSEAEIDYLLEWNNGLLPVEVKAGKTGKLKSLQVFVGEKKIKKALRFNTDLPSKVDVNAMIRLNHSELPINFTLYSLPFYLVQMYRKLME